MQELNKEQIEYVSGASFSMNRYVCMCDLTYYPLVVNEKSGCYGHCCVDNNEGGMVTKIISGDHHPYNLDSSTQEIFGCRWNGTSSVVTKANFGNSASLSAIGISG